VLPAAYIEYMQTPVDCAVGSRFYVIDLQLFGGLGFQMQCVRIALAWPDQHLLTTATRQPPLQPAFVQHAPRAQGTAGVQHTLPLCSVQPTRWPAACSEVYLPEALGLAAVCSSLSMDTRAVHPWLGSMR